MRPRPPPLSPSAWLRHDLIRELLEPLAVRTVLEVGAGQGAMGARLARRYDYVGIEPDARSAANARARMAVLGRGRVECCAFESFGAGDFDLVCAFEVLEHLADDEAAVRSFRAHIRPGGWLLLSVPAWQDRWGAADEHVGHHRRYSPAGLTRLLTGAGFQEVRTRLYGFPLGYVLEAVRNRLAARAASTADVDERTAGSARWFQPPAWAGAATMLAALPFRVLQRPFTRSRRLGTGIVAIARLPPDDVST